MVAEQLRTRKRRHNKMVGVHHGCACFLPILFMLFMIVMLAIR